MASLLVSALAVPIRLHTREPDELRGKNVRLTVLLGLTCTLLEYCKLIPLLVQLCNQDFIALQSVVQLSHLLAYELTRSNINLLCFYFCTSTVQFIFSHTPTCSGLLKDAVSFFAITILCVSSGPNTKKDYSVTRQDCGLSLCAVPSNPSVVPISEVRE